MSDDTPKDDSATDDSATDDSVDDSAGDSAEVSSEDSVDDSADGSDTDAANEPAAAPAGSTGDEIVEPGETAADHAATEPAEPTGPAEPAQPAEPAEPAEPADFGPTTAGATLPPPSTPTGYPTQTVRRLYRDPNGPIAGVATGIARFLGVDPLLIQVLFVLFALLGGAGVGLYVALWLVLPTVAPDGRLQRPEQWQTIAGATILALILFIGTIKLGIAGAGGLAIVLIIVGVVLLSQRPGATNDLGAQFRETFSTAPQPVGPSGYVSSPATGVQTPTGHPQAVYPVQPTPMPYRWATPRTDTAPYARVPIEPAAPRPPITALTMAIAVLAAGVMLVLGSVLPISAAATWGVFALVCGAGLVASAFTGRGAWLLLLPASIALIGMGASISAERWSSSKWVSDWSVGQVDINVSIPDDLNDDYSIGVGELNLDLTDLELTEDESFDISVGVGEANVLVPEDMNVVLRGDIGRGEVTWFGETISSFGGNALQRTRHSGSESAPELIINADVGLGELNIENG